MEIKFLNQPKDIKMIEILSKKLESKDFSKAWIFAGFVKDSGLDCLLNSIQIAEEHGMVVECILGLDKKNTSKDMLLKLLKLGCKIRFYINDEKGKLETRIYAFESDKAESYIYLTGAKLSEGGLTENIALITEIKYSLEEKKEFNKAKLNIESGANSEEFKNLDMDILKDLASSGEIVARITERKIPRISERYNQGEIEMGIQEYDENATNQFNELVQQDIDIDIDIMDASDIKVQSTLGEEVEHRIKNKVGDQEKEATIVSKLLLNEKDVNYEAMNTCIIPINRVVKKGATAGEIKISSAISMHMNTFFAYPKQFHMQKDEKGKLREEQEIVLEIFENMTKRSLIDSSAKIIQTEKYSIIKSIKLTEMDIEENDIMRFMKQGDGKYRCEIIKKGSSEYSVWENFCTISVKGTSKKFGIL